MECPLCKQNEVTSFKGVDQILFWKCAECYLIYKDSVYHLPLHEEHDRYLKHNNTLDCPGYIDFLNQALKPALPFLDSEMQGLDFGSGHNPVLAELLNKSGFSCNYFDPFFFPELPDERLDFIFSTETFEHFVNPYKDIKLITSLLVPDGLLTVMTHRWNEHTDLSTWWYMREHTHVSFFHKKTFDYICDEFGYNQEYDDGEKVIILRKNVVIDVKQMK